MRETKNQNRTASAARFPGRGKMRRMASIDAGLSNILSTLSTTDSG